MLSRNRNTIGRPALRRARLCVGLTLRALAARLGCTAAAVQAWESGERAPLPRYYPALAEALRLPVGELVDLFEPVASNRPAA